MASSPKAPSERNVADPIDARLVRRLADILTETGLTEIEVEHAGLKVRVARNVTVHAVAHAPAHAAAPAPAHPTATPAAAAAPPPETHKASDQVSSPMVGTVYLQAQPGDPPFVSVGDTVTAGQTLMIVEAMKTMNPIPAPKGGKIVEILVDDGQAIEFGEPLAVIA